MRIGKRKGSRIFSMMGFFCLLMWSFNINAQWIQATGKALIENGQFNLAREAARKDALRNAAMKYGSSVDSLDQMSNGRLIKSHLSVHSKGHAKQVKILNEEREGDLLTLHILANMVDVQSCSPNHISGYKKKVAFVGFSMVQPEEAAVGQMYDIERAIPGMLASLIEDYKDVRGFQASNLRLYDDVVNAPTRMTHRKTLSKAIKLASQMGVQFVVSGVVRDISLVSPEAYESTRLSNFARWIGLSDKRRHFAIDVYIHDGFSGEILFQKTYQTIGRWNANLDSSMNFGSPEFLATNYGQKVEKLLAQAAYDIADALKCQPFMTRITRVDGRTLQFDSGANSGVRPGDKFSVYRTLRLYEAGLIQNTELTNVKAALTVSQVHPGFASGKLVVDAGQLNIQQDDMLIAW
jgi:hypothetical protein